MAAPPPARKEGDAAETTDVGAASLATDEGPTAARLSFKLPHDTVRDEQPLRPGDGPSGPAAPDSDGSKPQRESGVVLRTGAGDETPDDDEPPTILRRAVGAETAEAERTLVELNKNPERPSPPPRAPELEMPTPAQPLSYEAAVKSLVTIEAEPDEETEVETLRVSGPHLPLAPIEAAMASPPPAPLPTAPTPAAAAPAAAIPPAAAKIIAAALAPAGTKAAAAAVALATSKAPAARPAAAPAPSAVAPSAPPHPAPSSPAPASPSASTTSAPAGILPLQRPKTATLEELASASPSPPAQRPARAPTPEELDAAAERLSHPPVPEMPRPRVATETIPLQLPTSERGMLLAFVGGVALVSFIAGLVVRGCFVDDAPAPPRSAEPASPPEAPGPAVERPTHTAPPPPHAQPAAPRTPPAPPPAKATATATPRPPVPPRKASPPAAVVPRTPSAPPRTQPAPRTPPRSRSASPPPQRVTAAKRAPAKRSSTPPPRATNRRQGPAQPGGFLRKAPF